MYLLYYYPEFRGISVIIHRTKEKIHRTEPPGKFYDQADPEVSSEDNVGGG